MAPHLPSWWNEGVPMTTAGRIAGRVSAGLGKGAGFTALPWVRASFIGAVGIDPHPGTLNLQLDSARDLWAWAGVRNGPDVRITPPDADQCDARCFPVLIAGRIPGAVVVPQVPAYPPDRLELVAPLPLRTVL